MIKNEENDYSTFGDVEREFLQSRGVVNYKNYYRLKTILNYGWG